MAKAPRILTIRVPVGGVVRQFEYQSQPPYTAADAQNFWPNDCKTGRRRIATRPGLSLIGIEGDGTQKVRGIYPLNLAGSSAAFVEGILRMRGPDLQAWIGTAWTDIDTGVNFATTRYIMAVPYNQKLYIADSPSGTAPYIYDPSGPSVAAMSATEGDEPDDPTVVAVHTDRLLWGGGTDPWILQLSRAGNPLDYDYSMTDAGSAWQITGSEGGNVGQRVNALLPHFHECTLIGSDHWVGVLQGDPGAGGSLKTISHNVGPLGAQAWCKCNDGQTAMLTRDGLFTIPPGCGDLPVRIDSRIPDDLRGIDPSVYEAFLAYDGRFAGLHIYVTDDSTDTRLAYWMDWEDGGFYPMELSATDQPLSILQFPPAYGDTESETIIGTKGGACKRFNTAAALDYEDAYIIIGPIRISPTPFHKSKILNMNIVFGSNTADTTGTVKIYGAGTAEGAYQAAVDDDEYNRYDLTVQQARDNIAFQPGVGGHAVCIRIEAASAHLSVEEINCTILELGAQRE